MGSKQGGKGGGKGERGREGGKEGERREGGNQGRIEGKESIFVTLSINQTKSQQNINKKSDKV